tara:strand:+ start:172 stop:324 length:153 start_codon:yes stop_codon:yes gene_type:complete
MNLKDILGELKMSENNCTMCKGKYGPIINNEVCAVCTGILEDEEWGLRDD